MVPVILMSDGYIANGSEIWRVPDLDALPPIVVPKVEARADEAPFLPYSRDEATLARPWATPGMPGLEHRIGGLEKQELTGNVHYAPLNHQRMTELRAEKLQRVAAGIHPTRVHGDPDGLLIIGWGSTYGAIREAVDQHRKQGERVAHIQLRNLNPFPPDLGEVLARYDQILVPELNMGQLVLLLRATFGTDIIRLDKVQGQPFKVREISEAITRVQSGQDLTGVCG
jgi:2-oxoglutarate ferredoxin oxidoreductase subunit alpha